MSRIKEAFSRVRNEGRTGLATFLTVGFPDREATLPLINAMVEGGVDIIELGIPFSDPLADGTTIQRSSQIALENGITLADCMDVCGEARINHPDVPLLMMGYYNPVLAYGIERFAKDGKRSGLDGLIVADLPPEEASTLRQACNANGIELIFLLAPTSTDERLRIVCNASTSFIYCVSLTGVTGARKELDFALPGFIGRVRDKTSLPLLVGFGISTREQVESVGAHADSVVVGSALINVIVGSEPACRADRVREFVKELVRC